MSFYGDIFRSTDERLNREDKDRGSQQYKFECAHNKRKVNVEAKYGTEKGDTTKLKVETPHPFKEDVKATFEMDKAKLTKTASCDVYNADGNKVNLTGKYCWAPAKQDHTFTVTKKTNTQDLGGACAHIQVDAEVTKSFKKNEKGEAAADLFSIKPNVVLAADDWKVGVLGEYSNGLTKLQAFGHYNCSSKTNSWARLDYVANRENNERPRANVGCTLRTGNWTHDFEAFYSFHSGADKAKPFSGWLATSLLGMSLPISLRAGHTLKMDDKTEFRTSVEYDDHCKFHSDVQHKIDGNWTGRVNHHYTSEGNKVDMGFEVSYRH